MSVEIIVPSLRQVEPERLVWSLSLGTQRPDIVTVVSNETQPFPSYGLRVRLVRFSSESYGIGDYDVALRQNVGIWATDCDTLIIQGDDQIAPPGMIEDSLETLGDHDHIWGNHRLADFSKMTKEAVFAMSMEKGASREDPAPPALHGFQSCYGGMFVARTDALRDFGGFDMAFNGRHAGEDQALGFRYMKRDNQSSVMIHEPPFSWHSLELRDGDGRASNPWLEPITNGCGKDQHSFVEAKMNGVPHLQCSRCPVWRFDRSIYLFRPEVLIRYDPGLVTTTDTWLEA